MRVPVEEKDFDALLGGGDATGRGIEVRLFGGRFEVGFAVGLRNVLVTVEVSSIDSES